jgi:sec-independent protein translocase protein TatB
MLSIPHMIVVFVIVLVVFGPQKLPELARGLGKLMAEFRKASTDFKSAFEEEMRDLERQAREVERKKQALLASANAALQPEPATLASPSGVETQAAPEQLAAPTEETRATEAGELTPAPVAEAVIARSSDGNQFDESVAAEPGVTSAEDEQPATELSAPVSGDAASGAEKIASHEASTTTETQPQLDPAHDRQQPA